VIAAVPGSRKHALSIAEAQERVRAALPKIDPQVLVPLAREPDDDPLLGPLLAACGPCVNTALGYAVLPPSRRFNIDDRRLFAARLYANGHTGFVVAPSDFRPEQAIWGFSESGLLRIEEYAMPSEWLLDFIEPLVGLAPSGAGGPLSPRAGEQLWAAIEGDLRAPQPAPSWAAPVQDGTYERIVEGVVTREEQYRGGKRHGTLRWWTLVDDFGDVDLDAIEDVPEPIVKRGPLVREGVFVDGFAHGPFRFFDENGALTHEVAFERGWPTGTCIVHPRGSGLAEDATIEYRDGIPQRFTIPPFAYASVKLERAAGPPATLAELVNGARVALVDCHDRREHDAVACDLPILGVGTPGPGRVGDREIEVVGDPTNGIVRAYGHRGEQLLPVTLIAAGGRFVSAGQLALLARADRQFATSSS